MRSQKPPHKKAAKAKELPFWKTKSLGEMSTKEWESLCDGCGKCCVHKFEDDDTGEVYFTDVACRLFDARTCRCKDYANRSKLVKDCVVLTPRKVARMNCLPETCAYRLVDEGKDLYWWHPLVSGSPHTVHKAGASARNRVVSEDGLTDEEIEERIFSWPKPRRTP